MVSKMGSMTIAAVVDTRHVPCVPGLDALFFFGTPIKHTRVTGQARLPGEMAIMTDRIDSKTWSVDSGIESVCERGREKKLCVCVCLCGEFQLRSTGHQRNRAEAANMAPNGLKLR